VKDIPPLEYLGTHLTIYCQSGTRFGFWKPQGTHFTSRRHKKMKNEIKDVLMRALETELKSEYVRTYLVDTLVDNLLKLEDEE
jgi:hypothetical protein